MEVPGGHADMHAHAQRRRPTCQLRSTARPRDVPATPTQIVVAVVVAVNQLEGDVLAPIVLGRSLRLHPLAILLALTAGTILAGIVGAMLAVPFAAVAWATVKTWRELSGRPPSGALDEEPLPGPQP